MPAVLEIARVRPSPEVRAWSDRHGFSPELVARWVEFHPRPQDLLQSLLSPTPRYMRVNTLRADADEVAASLAGRGFGLTRMPAPDPRFAVYRVDEQPFALASTPENLMGQLYVQDLASLTAPAALAPRPGDVCLDMAAAPGGKTTAIVELTEDEAPVLAVDPAVNRAAALASNVRRLGMTSVAVKVARGETLEPKHRFDRILLDAPCTGEGVLPRDPHRRTGNLDEHAALYALQRRLMARAAMLLEPGGVLVYSACTFSPEECEGVVQYGVELGLEPEPLPFDALGGVPLEPPVTTAGPWRFDDSVRHARRVYPDRHGTLGFFVARLRRSEDQKLEHSLEEGFASAADAEKEQDESKKESVPAAEHTSDERVGVEG